MIIGKVPKAFRWKKDLNKFLKMLADSYVTFNREHVLPEGDDEGGDYITLPSKRGEILFVFKRGELKNITIVPKKEEKP